jgi:branched-chain amino acid transport system substrate-binding protein
VAETKRAVKIGCVLPLGGFESTHARSQLLAVELALDEVQQELNLPYEVKLVVRDDEVNTEKAKAIAEEFVADDEMVAVVGPMNSDTNLATGDIFERGGLVHIATAASNPTLTQRGWRTFFRVVSNDIHHYRDAAHFAVRHLGARRIAVVNDGSTFTRPMAEGFRDVAVELGAQVPAFVNVQRGKDDYSDAVEALVGHEYDLIFFVVIEDVARILAPQLREAGVTVPFFATDGLKPLPYFATPDYEVDGPYYTNVCADPAVRDAAGAMVSRYIARYDEKPTVYMAEAYDAAGILLHALAQVGSDNPSRAAVLEAVSGMTDYAGTSGNITFDAHGDISEPAIGIYKYENGGLTFLGFTKDLLRDQPAVTA